MRKIILPIFAILFIFLQFFLLVTPLFAQTDTPTPTPTGTTSNSSAQQDLKNKIADLESKISDLKGQEKSLSDQISVMDSQIKLQELRIENTKDEIASTQDDIETTKKKIGSLESTLSNLVKVLMHRIVATYEAGTTEDIQILIASKNVGDFLKRANYLKLVQAHDKQLIYDTQQAKNDYANQKSIFEQKEAKLQALNAELEDYNKKLDAQKSSKQTLLSETQGSEANYQRILAQTQAQLASFGRFVTSQGGSGLLSGQTTCDSWGCYYSQRDTQWGSNPLNGTQYTLASDGCLVTSMAMVFTHYGHREITPQSINSISSNFDGIPAALLKRTIVGGRREPQSYGSKTDVIDGLLKDGPVIVGINAYGGTHFVVLRSGSGGSYMMNDPYIAGGNNISFNANYSVGSIYEIDKVIIN